MAIHHEENLNNEGQATTMDLDKMVCLIDTLKDSVKHFGHYELVNLTSSAGDQVIIKM